MPDEVARMLRRRVRANYERRAPFGPLVAGMPAALDGVHYTDHMPLEAEPARVRDDLAALGSS